MIYLNKITEVAKCFSSGYASSYVIALSIQPATKARMKPAKNVLRAVHHKYNPNSTFSGQKQITSTGSMSQWFP